MNNDNNKDVAEPVSSDARIMRFEANDETVEIFEAFGVDFLYFLRHKEGSIKILQRLAKKGNEKAGLIANYLATQPLTIVFEEKRAVFLKNAKNTAFFNTTWGAFDLKWPDFAFVENNSRVSFSCDIFMHNSKATTRAVYTILSMNVDSPLWKRFLQKILVDWLAEQGYKLKRYTETKGHYYCDTSIVCHDRRPPEVQTTRSYDIVTQATGIYQYDILPM